jgi:hypothetical protein
MQENQPYSELTQFIGSERWTSAGPLFPNVIYSEGAVFMAEKAKAWWLLKAIARHLVSGKEIREHVEKNPYFLGMHFWGLRKEGDGAVLTCVEDTGLEPIVTQKIEYTDFPFPRSGLFLLYVGNDGPGTMTKIFLPSEY